MTFNSYSRESSTPNKFKFQGQEHIDDLNLGWDSFKWRNHQPDIGRFFNIDPLAEKYYYNSPYAFSENKVVAHVELEGLESVKINIIEAVAYKNGKVHATREQIYEDKNVYDKTFSETPQYGGKSKNITTNLETSDGTFSEPNLKEFGASGFEQMFDYVTTGNLDNFGYNLNGDKTENGSLISGTIEGAGFAIDISRKDDKVTFTTGMSGGDLDNVYLLKVSDGGKGITIGALKAGRDNNETSSSSVTLSFTVDDKGKMKFNYSEYVKRLEEDKEQSTKK